MMNSSQIGAIVPRVLLPRPGIDLSKWAVIACDQFTSEPEYWQEVARLVGAAPSTYHLILPEVELGTSAEAQRVQTIHRAMQDYLDGGLFVEHEGLILVERSVAGRTRHGILLALDLEQYDYSKGATSLIRATEGTILERIPPRVRIRSGAPLELPHILVLIDDPACTVIEPLVAVRQSLNRLYDFDLMLDSGHLTGYSVGDRALEGQALAALARLAGPGAFAARYGLAAEGIGTGRAAHGHREQGTGSPSASPLLFAMGDGNHSLATAKAIWEQIKSQVGMEHPARYALVEVENIHDEGLEFEPILRVAFDVKEDVVAALERFYPGRCRFAPCSGVREMVDWVEAQACTDGLGGPARAGQAGGREHAIGVVSPHGCSVLGVADPPANLPVGTLQSFLDDWGKRGGFERIDYVHGEDVTVRLGSQPGNLGFYLPAIAKSDFFKTVIVDGALPRKTFSMGEAREKRFYFEARRIA